MAPLIIPPPYSHPRRFLAPGGYYKGGHGSLIPWNEACLPILHVCPSHPMRLQLHPMHKVWFCFQRKLLKILMFSQNVSWVSVKLNFKSPGGGGNWVIGLVSQTKKPVQDGSFFSIKMHFYAQNMPHMCYSVSNFVRKCPKCDQDPFLVT